MPSVNPIFNRTALLVGDDAMNRLVQSRVIIFGVGGVGSWCAESLVRSGIGHLTIVDSDRVCVTNINRQLIATVHTVGRVKVEALRERLLEINPKADIKAVQEIYSAETASSFGLEQYDYIIDAIDSLADKVHLLHYASTMPGVTYSSMGAALKLDPTQVRVAEFWKVQGCPLARAMRKRIKSSGLYPRKKIMCVYSPELLTNQGRATTCGTEACLCPKAQTGEGRADLLNHEWCSSKAQINGTMTHITALFGFTIAGLVVRHLMTKK
ncbi:MAG: tRNA threonylcarbamoyladenosine dehydratase [Bacteroidales bacterium]|nr:tRNA threonylcarbamoyladenosine dehydratase [Bacteroidales bacterium]